MRFRFVMQSTFKKNKPMEQVKTTIFPDRVSSLEAAIFPKPPIYRDGIFITGLVLTLLSALIFFFPEISANNVGRSRDFGLFFGNYALTVCYFFVLIFGGLLRFKWRDVTKNYTENLFLFQILLLISAFSLNRDIPIFEQSATWLAVSLVSLCVTLVALCFREMLPKPVLYGLYFLLGSGLVLYLYFSIYLLPFYPIGLMGAIILGFSLHVFVPLFSLLFLGVHVLKASRKDKYIRRATLAGIAVPLVVLVFFLLGWENVRSKINYAQNQSLTEEELLPNWVAISRQLPATPLAEKLIKTDLVYSTPSSNFWNGFNLPNGSLNETRKHDPLVMISCLLLGKPDLAVEDRIKILEAMYDARHKTQERLWSGTDLSTSNVSSNVMIYPDFRMAYTEKILSVQNNGETGRWNQQEAIYTFHLPEGGVVTSLSLWINGREEKGILTTKAKAENAYKTIVGVEVRDPSVVHWQEGNTVSVRVFPCTPDENRRFKIGVTAPLRKEGEKLVYQNIYFDGPSAAKATESVKLSFGQTPQELQLPFSFKKENATGYTVESYYRPYWEILLQAPPLSRHSFSFDGRHYRVQDYRKTFATFQPEAIYLDLNSSWKSNELLDIWQEIKHRNVYAWNGQMVRLTDQNLEQVFDELRQHNFSLFPLHYIPAPENSLIISRSNSLSPNLKNLQESAFARHLKNAMQKGQKTKLFNIGEELSPYLKTLKELRAFTYDQGSTEELAGLLKQQKFVVDPENEHTVVIHNAGIKLTEAEGETSGGAPDHLLRLFTYNHLMQQLGSNYFTENFEAENLIAEAQKAYVISPLSSLVVLETQADYDRFNIKDSDNASLRNASMHGSGSVPEPHEWFLIIMVATVAVYLCFRPNMIPKRG